MQREDAVEELAERARGLRWLTTDSAAARLDDEAQQFIIDRLDEHHAALAGFSAGVAVEPPLRIERSLYAARYACGYFGDDMMWIGDDVPAPSERAVAWARALDRARAAVIEESRRALGSARCAAVIETVRSALREQGGETERADRSLLDRMRSMISRGRRPSTALAIGGELFDLEALRVASGREWPSPWRPIMNLWERGLAPLASLDGELLVYVPVYVDGALVGDPSPDEPLHPADPRSRFERASDSVPVREQRASRAYFEEGYRFMPREWQQPARIALWTIVHRFARHGFAPTPTMMLFNVDTTPAFVATNTPALALTTYVPRVAEAPLDAASFDAWADAADDDDALIARATPEGLARGIAGFWDG
jgi:hypothetical protein